MVRSGRGGGEVLLVLGAAASLSLSSSSSRQVEEGWRLAERRRIWERRKAVLRTGTVLAFERAVLAGASIMVRYGAVRAFGVSQTRAIRGVCGVECSAYVSGPKA